MKISFHGAARTVTGSKHIIHLDSGKKILLDCGLFQGMGATKTLELNKDFGFEPSEVDYVIISHAHIDHIGLLPKLVKEGYKGKIFCTEATQSLGTILLKDSAHIQEADVKYANKSKAEKNKPLVTPLYTMDDAYKVFPLFQNVPFKEWFKIDDDIELMYTDAGHIIGSACVHLKLRDNDKTVHLTFSGDIGRYNDAILKSPETFPQADIIIMESTYGDKLHPSVIAAYETLWKVINNTCIKQKGKVIIPAFSVGRTQELLYTLNQFELEGRLPPVDYYVDSPLSYEATDVVKKYPNLYNKKLQDLLNRDDDPFAFKGLTMIEDVEASKALNFKKEPCVIISASGMAEAGRVKHHIANNVEDPKNTILMVGYCEPASLGARLLTGAEEIGIFGKDFKVKASIESIRSLSAHGDYEDMCQWLSCQDPKIVSKLFLVHGEYEVQQVFREKLFKKGFTDIQIPDLHQEFGIGNID